MKTSAVTLAIALLTSVTGCEQRERMMEMKAPGVDVKVDKVTPADGGPPHVEEKVEKRTGP